MQVFDTIDTDRSGYIGFDEMFEFIRGRRHSLDRRSQRVKHLSIAPPPGAVWSLEDVEWEPEPHLMHASPCIRCTGHH